MSALQKLAYALPHIWLNFAGMFMAQKLASFYVPSESMEEAGGVALVSAGAFSALILFGSVIDAIADPPIGWWSDRLRSRFGRRMPFVVAGTPIMALTFIAHFFPPDAEATVANIVWLAVVLFAYKISFTAVLGPYEALFPEIARDEATRVSLSGYLFGAMVVGNILGALAGLLETALGVGGLAILCGVGLLLFLVPPLLLSESPDSEAKVVSESLVSSLKSVYSNPAFVSIVVFATFGQMALAMLVADLDYYCHEVIIGDANTWRSVFVGATFLSAAAFVPWVQRSSIRGSKKRVLVRAGWAMALAFMLFPATALVPRPEYAALAMMILMGYPAAAILILARVFIADVADYDEAVSGKRREGILNGAMALVAKLGQAGPAIVVQVKVLGDSREDPTGILAVGPVAAAMVILATLVFRRFPEAEVKATIARFRASR